ncbi:MAG: thiolase family protein [Thermoplasmata archaeon]|nr:acetyl-CoA C-acyltransferase [Euryarchaeota archaeon]MVT35271.1 acetyl-CoA C-acyltransferase [Euryarchaeota archaeon]
MNTYIVSAVRTPVGKYGRSFLDVPAVELGRIAVEEAIKRAGIKKELVDEVIMGNVLQCGLGQNPARQVALKASFPNSISAFTVNKVCGSGLKAVTLGAQAIKAGDADIIVAGGMENMSQAPYFVRGVRFGLRYDNSTFYDEMIYDGLWDIYYNVHMIKTGEVIAEKYGLTRQEIDEFAYRSHMRAKQARDSGRFEKEIVPVKTNSGEVKNDEGIRDDTTVEKLLSLKPVLKDGRFVTAGNASQLSDGASALVLMSEKKIKELGIEPMAMIIAYNTVGVDPLYVMEAPIPGTRALLEKTGMRMDDIDVFEHNEAYASASVAVKKALNIPEEIFNIHGGAVALGHPIGASGARVLTTLLHSLIEVNGTYGLETICLGGGNAVSIIVENLRRR